MKKTLENVPLGLGRKALSILLAFVLCAGLFVALPTTVRAAGDTTIDVSDYAKESGTGWTYSTPRTEGGVYTISAPGTYTITGNNSSENENSYVVVNAETAESPVNITLSNATINNRYDSPLQITTGSTVNLTLLGTNQLIVTGSGVAGLNVPSGATLNITAADTDQTLTASGNGSGAGIGGNIIQTAGTITINGGTVTATGGPYGAGIGGGGGSVNDPGGGGGTIRINGGTVTATGGGYGGAGIGGGAGGASGSGEYPSRTGGGAGGNITITGGTVDATGGGGGGSGGLIGADSAGAGIGGGYGGTHSGGAGGGAGGAVAISGSTTVVKATGGTGTGKTGYDIGGGGSQAGTATAGTLSITGGSVELKANGTDVTEPTLVNCTITGTGVTDDVKGSYGASGEKLKEITGYTALTGVTLSADEHITSLTKLIASGKLPTTVEVTDGTTPATATITNWTAESFTGAAGEYALTAVWTTPSGYVDAESSITVTIIVTVSVGQTVYIPPYYPPAPPVQTLPGNEGEVEIVYTEKGGEVALELPNRIVEELLESAEGGAVEIDLSGLEGAEKASLPAAALEQIADAGLGLNIELPGGGLSIDADALADIIGAADGENLSITLIPHESPELNESQREILREEDVVYEIALSSGAEIHEFNGKISATVAYDGETPVSAWYMDDEGKLEKIAGGKYNAANKTFTFDLPHLSLYVIGYDEVAAWVNPFTDVFETDWFYENVCFAATHDPVLMGGTSATTFAPNAPLTRAMAYTILARMAGETISGASWIVDATAWAVETGISDGTNPTENITRGMLATMLYRFAGVGEDGWDGEAMEWSAARGIISDGRPEDTATRAEMAAVISRFCATPPSLRATPPSFRT